MVRRCSVVAETLVPEHDYADAFEVDLAADNDRTAEQVMRSGFRSAPKLSPLVALVHRYVLQFDLQPVDGPEQIGGWRIVRSTPEVLQLQAEGPLFSGALVVRRDGRTARLSTMLTYRHRSARWIWLAVGPVHRRVAPNLMRRAAGAGR